MEPEEAAQAVSAGQRPLSLTSEEESGGQIDIAVESEAEKIGERLALRQVINELEERDRKILERRLIDGIVFEKLAEEFDMSPRQIRNIVYKNESMLFRKIK